jgi:nitroimidazol reductase NimA-like FMN-containing flavoprotein (pyridoxamine 5'-phosphate oxidase superfamily)
MEGSLMKPHESHASTVELSREECLGLLASVNVGRIAWISDGVPHILPVNHRVLHDQVVFRTASGSELGRQAIGAAVAFEVDNVDYGHLTGWSVVVNGTCRPVDDAQDRAVLTDALTSWVEGAKEQVFTIEPTSITGRRLVEQTRDDGP